MIHAKKINGGQIRHDTLIFVPQDLRHGEFLTARASYQENHHLFCLADIWSRHLDIADFNLLGLI